MDRSIVGLLEAALHSWPITLRLVLLITVLATGTAVVAVKLGIVGQVVLLALGYLGRRRSPREREPEGEDGEEDEENVLAESLPVGSGLAADRGVERRVEVGDR